MRETDTLVAAPAVALETCFLTGEPVFNQNLNTPGWEYSVVVDGQIRRIVLAPHDYQNDGWFRANHARVLKKIKTNNHWHYLDKGLTFNELLDYFVAPCEVL